VIDTHVHAVSPRLPGVKPLPDFLDGPPEEAAAVLRRQMQECGAEVALGMGHLGGGADDPLGVASTLRLAELVPGLHAIGAADPSRTGTDHLQAVEGQLRAGRVKALKGYLGYLPYGPGSPNYVPYYELAARYQVPFIFHTGDTYSTAAKVKYAHPLLVDEVAVDHRGVNFVLAHFGNPWVTDAAEVVYKNANVWADLSGVLVGDEAAFAELAARGVVGRTVERLRQGVEYAEQPEKFLYGTDWPLAPMAVYRDFVRQVFPEKDHPAVFGDTARALFNL
jgi:predicted TIM-barrel fold metal-dependent hydrolase